nr:Chain D, capsid protein VP4 [Foot-and-mouth disease virus A]
SGNTGSIINNYYMQQYQNSMDTQLNDWFSKLASSAFSGLFGALLA